LKHSMRILPTLAVALASSATPIPAQTIWDAANRPHSGVYELRCRGGAGFEYRNLGFKRSPGGDTLVAVALVFAANPKAAGLKGEGLEPGSCAWLDRPLNAAEPREVRFIASGAAPLATGPIDTTPEAAERDRDVHSIAAYLKDPKHHWSFTAFNTNQGYFDAVTHGSWRNSGPQRPPVVDQQADSSTATWVVRAGVSGGHDGRTLQVSVDADGRLRTTSARDRVSCSAELSPNVVRSIEAALARAHAERWAKSYVNPNNPQGCCDIFANSLRVEMEDSQRRKTPYETQWFSDSGKVVPESVSSLFSLVWSAVKVCTVQP
jgi:hypothetical protein